MFKNWHTRLLATIAAIVCSAGIALGTNISLITTPTPASDLQFWLNYVIQQVNAGTGGLLNAQTGAASTTATTVETTLQTYSMPANTLAVAGQAVRVSCWGVTGADTNTKTTKLYFGSSVITTATEASNAQKWVLNALVMRKTATTQGVMMTGQAGTSSVTPLAPVTADGTETLTGAVVIKCTGTNGTASAADITANGMLVEMIK